MKTYRQSEPWKFLPSIVVLSLVVLAPPQVGAHGSTHHSEKTGNKPYEVRFLEQMIDHHMMAVEMGKECGTSATHQELKDLCQGIASGQTAEITTMKGWLQSWYKIDYIGKPMAMKGMGSSMSSMKGMGASMSGMKGREYEIAFLQGMKQHHRMAVRMARECQSRAKHPELKAMCLAIVSTQTKEVEQMQTWLCEWYQKCPPGRK